MEQARRPRAVRVVRWTTWKCGRLERRILDAILAYLSRHPRAEWVPLEAVLAELRDERLSEVRDAMRRLVRRRILEVRYG